MIRAKIFAMCNDKVFGEHIISLIIMKRYKFTVIFGRFIIKIFLQLRKRYVRLIITYTKKSLNFLIKLI